MIYARDKYVLFEIEMMALFTISNLGGMVEYSEPMTDINVRVTNEGTEANWRTVDAKSCVTSQLRTKHSSMILNWTS